MSDETTLHFNLDDEGNEKRVVVRVSELVRCLKHFRESLLSNGGDYEHDMREVGGHLKAAELGGGTGDWILEHSGTLYDKWRCSKCGYLYVSSRCDAGATDFDPNYCPNCGRRLFE